MTLPYVGLLCSQLLHHESVVTHCHTEGSEPRTHWRRSEPLVIELIWHYNMSKCARPCSLWDKWNVSSGQTPCPCPTCPMKIWRPPSPCSTCPTKIWRPPFPCPTCPTTPTYPNLSHLVVTLVLCQLSFLRFFFWFLSVIPFSKNTFEWKVFFKVLSCWRGYKWQPNFHKKTGDNRDHTLEHMGIFFSEFNSSVSWFQHTKNS